MGRHQSKFGVGRWSKELREWRGPDSLVRVTLDTCILPNNCYFELDQKDYAVIGGKKPCTYPRDFYCIHFARLSLFPSSFRS